MSYNIPIQYVQQSPSPQPSPVFTPNASFLPSRNNLFMSNQDKNNNNTTYTIPVNLTLSNNNTNKANLINTTTNNNNDIDNLNNYNISLTGNMLNKQQYDLKQQQQMNNFKGLINTTNLDEEDEVDLLKDLLMKNLNSSSDPNFYGVCMKCSEKIYGADNGLRAMDQLFHVKCFVCHGCGYSLQGQHFYAMDNKSFCENCYMVRIRLKLKKSYY